MIYLDNAATTFPKPAAVYDRSMQFMRETGGNPGRGGHSYAVATSAVVETTRKKLAKFFGVPDPNRVIFTYNCTDSINMVLHGFLHSGNHVITTALDHNAVSRPLEYLRRTKGIEITRLPFDKTGLAHVDEARTSIKEGTTLIVVNHGSNVLGSVQPLDAWIQLARETGIPLLLDAAQTAGRIPVMENDAPVFIACSAHKGLYGMPGLGILTVPMGIALEKWREGGTGTASESLEHPDQMPMRLEAGTPNFLAIASVSHGLDYIAAEGMEKIHALELDLAGKLYRALVSENTIEVYSRADTSERIAVIAFNIRGVPSQEAAAILDQTFGIAVRAGLHCAAVAHAQIKTSPDGCLRASPGYFNTAEEVDALIASVKEIAGKY